MTDLTQSPSSLIDAGWQALQAGDLDHADAACRAALGRDPELVDGLILSAAIAMARGDVDASMSICRQAMKIDPGDPRPFIQAAELELYSGNDSDAIELAVRAIDAAGDEADFVDAALIKAAAEIGSEKDDDARRTLGQVGGCSIDEPPLLLRLGELWLEIDDAAAARRAFTTCIALAPDLADAHHGLGLACDELGDETAMRAAFERTHRLDQGQPREPWHLSPDEFAAVASATIADLPTELREHLGGVSVHVEPTPSAEQIATGLDPRLLGRFESTEATDPPTVAAVYLYQDNLERSAGGREHLDDEIRLALVHECATVFGLDDDDLAALGID